MLELAPVFQTVQNVMEVNRPIFNQADTVNGNHGDHMVEIFAIATRAAQEKRLEGLAAAMDEAGVLLSELADNGSARVYAHGLAQLGAQFQKDQLTQQDLVFYLHKALKEDAPQPASSYTPNPAANQNEARSDAPPARSGDVLKALVSALAGWQQAETGQGKPSISLDLGTMFDLGIAYMQAKQRNSSRVEVIADAAASVSPLNRVPYRCQSGKLAIRALLETMAASGIQDIR